MNSLTIVAIAIVVLVAGYALYGRWLAKTWGIDPKAKTPAYTHEDGEDYIPTPKAVVFSHQFSSIAGAGPVTGPIIAAMFEWLPVLLWLLIGGIFFGAVQDFTALYASVKNEGKSMGVLIEKYIGKTGRKLFLLFSWLFTLLVIAAFTDMVAGTFNGFTVTGAKSFTKRCRCFYLHVIYLRSCCFRIIHKICKTKPESRICCRTCITDRYVSRWYCLPIIFYKKYMDRSRYGLLIPCICYANVANDAAS